jgi:endonuclease/exonuclease/phosphatase family metal-dependent hydrolase
MKEQFRITKIAYKFRQADILILFLGVTLNFCIGCQNRPQPNYFPEQDSIRVITYNVNWGFNNPQNVVSFLDDFSADVICLQETHRQWQGFLTKNLKEQYPYIVFKECGIAGGLAILSKYQIRDVNFIEPLPRGMFPALLVEIQTSVGEVQFLNVHLRPAVSKNGSFSLSAVYESHNIHSEEIQYFLSKAKSDKPLIIAGDFNENENDKAINHLIKNGFNDALSIYDTYGKTWAWKAASFINVKDRLDHIIFNNYLQCTAGRIVPVNASDHIPVLAVFVQAP